MCELVAELVFVSNTFVAVWIGRTIFSFTHVCCSDDWQNYLFTLCASRLQNSFFLSNSFVAVKIGRTSVSFKHVCGSDDLQNSCFTMSCLLCASRLAELVFLSNTFVAVRIGITSFSRCVRVDCRTSVSFKRVCGSEDWQN